jgi:formate hydrogenlyase subunit 3/multisubunit Na+/H+ antiporter MnhD subunit
MGLDIRYPIGLMFGIIGLVMVVYGLLTGSDPMYQRSLGINVNVWWGAVLLLFGSLMLYFARKTAKESAPPKA